jgi:aspartate ammonia-lyase
MPGKVNPVIPEAVSQAAVLVMSNDQAVTQASAMGNLELNAFMPLIADALLSNIDLLCHACRIFRVHCVAGIEADESRCRSHVEGATALLTALVDVIGYEKAQEIGATARSKGKGIREVAISGGFLSADEFDRMIAPENVSRLGSPADEETL